MFSNEAVDPRRDNGQRYRAKLEYGIVVQRARRESRTQVIVKFMHHKRLTMD